MEGKNCSSDYVFERIIDELREKNCNCDYVLEKRVDELREKNCNSDYSGFEKGINERREKIVTAFTFSRREFMSRENKL